MQSKPCGVKMRSKDEYPRERRVRNQASGDLVQKLPRGNFIQKDQAAKNLLRSHGASSKAAMVCRGVGLRSPSDTGFRAQRRFAMVLGIVGYAVLFCTISCGSDFSDHGNTTGHPMDVTGTWFSKSITESAARAGATAGVRYLTLEATGHFHEEAQYREDGPLAPAFASGCTAIIGEQGQWIVMLQGQAPVLWLTSVSKIYRLDQCSDPAKNRAYQSLSPDSPSSYEYVVDQNVLWLRDTTTQNFDQFSRPL